MPEEDRLVDTKTLARILNVSPYTVYDYVTKGLIPVYRMGRALRFKPSEVLAALRDGAPEA